MSKLNIIRRSLLALVICLILPLFSCGNIEQDELPETTPAVNTEVGKETSLTEVLIDYGNAEVFETALNKGENLEGKVVRFTAREYHPDSALGYNIWAGEHLNFVSSSNPDIKENDTVAVRVTSVENSLGSWILNYEKVENAVVTDDTIIDYSDEKENEPATKEKATKKKYVPTEESTEKEELPTENSYSEEESENTYEHNEYYDIVETGSFVNSIDDTIVVHKVLAKKDATVSATLLAYDANGDVVGKSSDKIVLTEGNYNYFEYWFDNDVSISDFQMSMNAQKDSFMSEERNAVEMVKYNQSGDDLYITFEQTGDKIKGSSKFKLLFYKGDQIVDAEDGHFDIYAENLNGKGSTDVAEIMVLNVDFDRVEFVFEP